MSNIAIKVSSGAEFIKMQVEPDLTRTYTGRTYFGLILSLQDALLVLEGTRRQLLPYVKRRLNDEERKQICAGAVYAWNESDCGMKRWTDGKIWLASKVKSPFLTYQELDESRNVKPDGLVKQIFSLSTKQNEKLHLIAYYDPLQRMNGHLVDKTPSFDPTLSALSLDSEIYQDDILGCQTDANNRKQLINTLSLESPSHESDKIFESPNSRLINYSFAISQDHEKFPDTFSTPGNLSNKCIYSSHGGSSDDVYVNFIESGSSNREGAFYSEPVQRNILELNAKHAGSIGKSWTTASSQHFFHFPRHDSSLTQESRSNIQNPTGFHQFQLTLKDVRFAKCLENTKIPSLNPNGFTAKSIPRPVVETSIKYNPDDRLTLHALDKQFVV